MLLTGLLKVKDMHRNKPEQSQFAVLSDEALVETIVSERSTTQFNLLVARYQKKVFDLVVSILGVRFSADAQDVTQEVFVVLYKQLDRFRHESKFSTWLYRVVFNHTIDYKRRNKHYRLVDNEEAIERNSSSESSQPDTQQRIEEERKQILSCMEHLPESQRICLYLKYWLGYSMNDIAQLLVTEENTVKSHLFRAKKKLAKLMEELGYEQ